MRVRGATLGDRDAVCKICLETGDAGDDATADYPVDPQALGKRWAVPYLELEPEFAFVIEDEGGAVCGYAFGALDTAKFAARLQAEYLPKLRAAHADPAASGAPESEWTSEQKLYHEYHDASAGAAPPAVADEYPSHLHIDLLAPARGSGLGRALMCRLFAALRRAGSRGVHLQMHASNARAARFYRRLGFQPPQRVAASEPLDDGRAAGSGGDLYLGLRFVGEPRGVAAAVLSDDAPTGTVELLSIFTAIWDWRASSERTGESYDEVAAAAARGLLDRRLAAGAAPPAPVLAELRREAAALAESCANRRCVEGSERHLARAIESQAGGRVEAHDRLIALCVLLAGAVQGQSVAPLAAFLRAGSVDCTPEALGLSPAALRCALTSVGELVHTAAPPLMPGVFHFFGSVGDADVDRVVAEACAGLRA